MNEQLVAAIVGFGVGYLACGIMVLLKLASLRRKLQLKKDEILKILDDDK